MDKIYVCVIIALTISSLLLLPSFAAASSTQTFTVYSHASGFVQYPASDPSTPTNKAVCVYGLSSADAVTSFIANHFTFLDTEFDSSAPALIKAKNPNMKIIGYKDVMGEYSYSDDWPTVNANESWFVHDASGNRIIMTVWGWYLMDCSSAGWRQHWISYVNGKMNNNAYDGVFADDVWDTIASRSLSSFDHTIPSSVISNWHNNMMGFLQYAKANMSSGKILFINTDDWNDNDYINIADGMMIEGYEHASWELITNFGRPSIDALAGRSATGKIVWAEPGIDSSTASQTQINTMLKYCYCSFLIGMNGPNAYFGWDPGNYDPTQRHYPIMDTNMGQPTGAYYSSQSVYMRDFTNGKVLFNPSGSSHTVSLGGTYKLLDGTIVTSVTLGPYNGEILLL
jgi:hypothetical protein